MAPYGTYLSRIRDTFSYYLGGIYKSLYDKDVFVWGQAIAFKVLITIVPLIILATGILGAFLSREEPFSTVAAFIRDFLPAYQSDRLIDFLYRLQDAGTTFTLVGIAGLLFAAMTLFTTLRIVISNVFQEDWHTQRGIFPGYAFDLRMAAQVGLLFLLTFGVTLLLQNVGEGGIALARRVGIDYVWVREGWRTAFRIAGLLIPYLLSAAMFWQLFYFIPKPHPPKRSALLGAVVTGLLWELAKYSFTLYAANIGRFDQYGGGTAGEEGVRVLGEAFGLIIALVFWAYYSGVVLIIGAIIAVLHEKRHRMKRLKKQRDAAEAMAAAPPTAEQEALLHADAVGDGDDGDAAAPNRKDATVSK